MIHMVVVHAAEFGRRTCDQHVASSTPDPALQLSTWMNDRLWAGKARAQSINQSITFAIGASYR